MPKTSTDSAKIDWLLKHAVENIYPSKETLKKRLLSGEQLTFYYGIDPTGPTLHLGHMITMKKLAELQKLGHKIILLIGDFTAMIGDPTDKSATRKQLTREQVLKNCKRYKKQAARILDFKGKNPVDLKYNSKWLAKMNFADIVDLASHFTVQQLLERDMFEKRFKGQIICPKCNAQFVSPVRISFRGPIPKDEEEGTGVTRVDSTISEVKCPACGEQMGGHLSRDRDSQDFISKYIVKPKPIYLHEFMYPLMQGYDSVAMNVDGEVGGNDQTFNMLAGRTLLKQVKGKEKYVITNVLLADATGKKMGKTEGNMIALTDSPEDMYGKVMSWTDGMIVPGYRLCTDLPEADVKDIAKKIEAGENPMAFKRDLAYRIVVWLMGEKSADQAAEHFMSIHSKRGLPTEIPEHKVSNSRILLVDALVESKLCSSKSDARRLVSQGAVRVADQIFTDYDAELFVEKTGLIIQKGKRHFVKLIV